MVAIPTIGLGAALRSSERGGLGRLGKMSCQSRPREFFRYEAPSGGGLQREVGVAALEGDEEFSDRLPECRHDVTPTDFPGFSVQPFERDLLSMHVECTYNPHWDLLDSSARMMGPQHVLVLEPRGSLYISSFPFLS